MATKTEMVTGTADSDGNDVADGDSKCNSAGDANGDGDQDGNSNEDGDGNVLCNYKFFGTYLDHLPTTPTSPHCDTFQQIPVSFYDF